MLVITSISLFISRVRFIIIPYNSSLFQAEANAKRWPDAISLKVMPTLASESLQATGGTDNTGQISDLTLFNADLLPCGDYLTGGSIHSSEMNRIETNL